MPLLTLNAVEPDLIVEISCSARGYIRELFVVVLSVGVSTYDSVDKAVAAPNIYIYVYIYLNVDPF